MALIGTMKYLTIGNNTYEIDGGDLPIASASTLGGIKVGSGLTIDSTTGVLNATGTSITIDNEMSDSSTNPVQNKVIKEYVDDSVGGIVVPTKTSDLTNDSGFVTTDEKVKQESVSTSNNKFYPVLFSTSNSTSNVTSGTYKISSFTYNPSTSKLTVNNIQLGGISSPGILSVGYLSIVAPSTTTTNTITLPNATGTIALTSDIPTTVSSFTNDAGYLTSNDVDVDDIPLVVTATYDIDTSKWVIDSNYTTISNAITNNKPIIFEGTTIGKTLDVRVSGPSQISAYIEDTDSGYVHTFSINSSDNVSYSTQQINISVFNNNSGYATLASPAFTGTPTAPTATSGDSSTQIATTAFVQDAMSGAGAGTVTSVGLSNATNGGLSISGSPITSSGSITVGHSNVLTSAQTTQAVYPIKIDKNGHISAYGAAVTSMPASDVSAWAKEATKPTYTYSEVGAAASSHTHGNITNGGDITATAPTIANGDQIIINDNSASKITNGPTFDGSTTTKALTPKGTWETFLQSFTESDPIFAASAAAGITSTDISNWNAKVSDDHKWNDVSLTHSLNVSNNDFYVPMINTVDGTAAIFNRVSNTPMNYAIAKYGTGAYLYSTTPSANDNSTKVATTAYVDAAIPDISGYVSKSGDTMRGNLAISSYNLTFTNSNAESRQTTTISQKYINSMGSYIGYLSVEGATIRNSYTPSHNYDLTNKQYVDNAISGITIPTKTSDLTNDSGFITGYTETDPTVPSWAKAASKPTYTASEVGALPSTTSIPSATSDLTNDSGFITANDVPTEVFIATYDTTTSAEIEAAYQAGKAIFVSKGALMYPFTSKLSSGSASIYGFTKVELNILSTIQCSNDTWTTTATVLVPSSRTINSKALSSNITLTPSDIGIHTSTSDPTSADGNDGDVWLVYSVPEPEE